MQNSKKELIDQICAEKGIEQENISYDWITILKKGKIEKKLVNYNFYLNTRNSVELAKDKYATYALLKHYQIPMIPHQILFCEDVMPDFVYVNQKCDLSKKDDKVVIKANDSSQGKDVYVASEPSEKLEIVETLFKQGKESVVVCPYMEIEYEYRAIFLDGEVIYMYKKQKPFVKGDGKSTIQELIKQQVKYLAEPIKDLKLEEVPDENETVLVGWKHNLSNGAIPILLDENDAYAEKIEKLAQNVGQIMELTFASIDLCVTKDQEIYVMEVNSNVTLTKFCELVPNGFEIGKEIYSKVIDKIFENK